MKVKNVFEAQKTTIKDDIEQTPILVTIDGIGKVDFGELKDAIQYGLDRYFESGPDVLAWVKEQKTVQWLGLVKTSLRRYAVKKRKERLKTMKRQKDLEQWMKLWRAAQKARR